MIEKIPFLYALRMITTIGAGIRMKSGDQTVGYWKNKLRLTRYKLNEKELVIVRQAYLQMRKGLEEDKAPVWNLPPRLE